jgi:ketosteroid isomerase-like protein
MSLAPEDLAQIQQLYAAYCHAVDDGDGKAFSACFTSDGVLDAGGPPVTGADGLAGFAAGVPGAVPGIRHVASNLLVDGQGDEAEGRAYLTAYTATAGAPAQPLVTGRYHDRLRRVDGRWLFSERIFRADG